MIVDRFGNPFCALTADEEVFQPGIKKPESDYIELNRLGKKLGIPIPLAYVTAEALDANGKRTGYCHDRMRTYNRNFYNYTFTNNVNAIASSGTFGAGVLSVKDTVGTTRTINGASAANSGLTGLCLNAAASTQAPGIVVGTGTTAESFEHNALVTPVAQGVGSGQLSHNAVTAPTPTYNAGTKVWTCVFARIYNNNSGGSIVIAETALYATFQDSINTVRTVMVERTLLGATVSVANAGQLTVTYTFTLTFPA